MATTLPGRGSNGASWSHGFLPGITVNQGGTYAQVSDAAVAYDAKHGQWMVVGLPIHPVLAENLVRAGRPPIEVALCWGSPP
jgi:hypothetical protein